MPRTLFTADLHAFHAGIIPMCQRPFSNVDDMNEALRDSWNAVARPDDVVWVVGDFAHRVADARRLRTFFDSLNGEKHLVIGNHDSKDTVRLPWKSAVHVAEIAAEGQRIFLSHYAHRVWPGQRRGTWMLYGHSHGRLAGNSQSLDVGVDCWGFCPVSAPQIRERLAELPPPEAEGDPEPDNNGGPTP